MDDERKIREILHAKKRETTLEALQRHMANHRRLTEKHRKMKYKEGLGNDSNFMTVKDIAAKLKMNPDSIRLDVNNGMLTPYTTMAMKKTHGKPAMVFTRKEANQYIEWKKSNRYRPAKKGKMELVAEYAEEHTPQMAAQHFGIALRTVRQYIRRMGRRDELHDHHIGP